MKKVFLSQRGITGIEITVAVTILMIFVSLISTIFINIYLNFTDSQRNTVAMSYATQISEEIDKMYYAEVTQSNIEKLKEEMRISKGYSISTTINNYTPNGNNQDLVKIVTIQVDYKVGNNIKTVELEKIKAKEILITPNKPKLSNGMVPVKYVNKDETFEQGYWQITTEDDSTWYNYDNKRWANIMLQDGLTVEGDIKVTDENRKSLAGKKVTTLGSMFVWIPRYAYKIPDANLHTSTAGEIDIVFLYSTSNNYIDENGNMQPITNLSGYKIHPSFQNGAENNYANGGWDTELTGYWVAKFEASSTNPSASDGGGDTTELDVKVLPSVPSWRYITANNMFIVCQNMANNGNIYNLSNNAEPHMMKNTEWGAVAYLSYSKYGMNGQVWNNPSKYCITGCVSTLDDPNAAVAENCDEYNVGNGPNGSTTGNVYGVYDMPGGSYDRTAAIIENVNAEIITNLDNLYTQRNTKYVDLYKATYDENKNKYGDAVYETSTLNGNSSGWDSDYTVFPSEAEPGFIRGGMWGNAHGNGLFWFSQSAGIKSDSSTFRPVITIP